MSLVIEVLEIIAFCRFNFDGDEECSPVRMEGVYSHVGVCECTYLFSGNKCIQEFLKI